MGRKLGRFQQMKVDAYRQILDAEGMINPYKISDDRILRMVNDDLTNIATGEKAKSFTTKRELKKGKLVVKNVNRKKTQHEVDTLIKVAEYTRKYGAKESVAARANRVRFNDAYGDDWYRNLQLIGVDSRTIDPSDENGGSFFNPITNRYESIAEFNIDDFADYIDIKRF